MMSQAQAGLVGGVLRALRVGYGLSQAAIAARVALERSWVSRLERGDHVPKPAVVQAWITACPPPVMPVDTAVSDALALAEPDGNNPAASAADMIIACRAPLFTASATTARRLADALRFPAAVTFAAEDLPPLLWWSLRALRAVGDRATASLVLSAADSTASESLSAVDNLSDALRALPVLSVPAAARPEEDLWSELACLWPRLDPTARRGLVAAAREWCRQRPCCG